ncbi:MAG: hypothetical protein QNJ92_11260 [Alphaproteobacteria bacterium]|nr:hypothetical protein [Alphaproteobacteria bacterium]
MKKLVLIVVILALVAGGTYAWLFLFNKEDQAEAEAELQEEVFVPPVYVQLAPFNVPVVRDGEVTGYVNITIIVEVADDEAREVAVRHMARLRDAFFRDLYATLPLRRGSSKGFEPKFVKRRMQAVSDRTLGQGVVTDILIQGVYEGNIGPS